MESLNQEAQTLTQSREAWFIPGAIIIAGLIAATALYIHRTSELPGSVEADITLLRPVTPQDHLVGNPDAAVTLITYADIDSSHAKGLMATMAQVMAEYAPSGNVAWVYRHLPLIDQHPFSAAHAEAAECAASLGGPAMFWRFIDTVNAQAPGTQQFNPRDYGTVATTLGLLPQAFDECIASNKFEERVAQDFGNGIAIGAGGSPFSVLLVDGLPPVTIDGALPYEDVKQLLDDAIARASASSL